MQVNISVVIFSCRMEKKSIGKKVNVYFVKYAGN